MVNRYSLDEVLVMAEQIERNGQRFYEAAAAHCTEPRARAVLAQLAEWEAVHESFFGSLRVSAAAAAELPDRYDPSGEAELYLCAMADAHVFAHATDPTQLFAAGASARQVVDLALRFERDSIAFFLGLVRCVSDDQATAVDRLVAEEQRHVAALQRLCRELD